MNKKIVLIIIVMTLLVINIINAQEFNQIINNDISVGKLINDYNILRVPAIPKEKGYENLVKESADPAIPSQALYNWALGYKNIAELRRQVESIQIYVKKNPSELKDRKIESKKFIPKEVDGSSINTASPETSINKPKNYESWPIELDRKGIDSNSNIWLMFKNNKWQLCKPTTFFYNNCNPDDYIPIKKPGEEQPKSGIINAIINTLENKNLDEGLSTIFGSINSLDDITIHKEIKIKFYQENGQIKIKGIDGYGNVDIDTLRTLFKQKAIKKISEVVKKINIETIPEGFPIELNINIDYLEEIIAGYRIPNNDRNINKIILHHTATTTIDQAINTFKERKLAPHYLLDKNGDLYYLVPEEYIAYHAANANSDSIGIEIVNTAKSNDEYTKEQYDTLNILLPYLLSKYGLEEISDYNVIAHYEISSSGKWDPSPNFDWSKIGLPDHPRISKQICENSEDMKNLGWDCNDQNIFV